MCTLSVHVHTDNYGIYRDITKEAFKTQTWWGKKNLEWGGVSPLMTLLMMIMIVTTNWHEHSTLTLLARVFNTYPN